MTRCIHEIVHDGFSSSRNEILDLFFVWSTSCVPLMKLPQTKQSLALRHLETMTVDLLLTSLNKVGIETNRPFTRASDVSKPLLEEIERLTDSLESSRFEVESLRKEIDLLHLEFKRASDILTILDLYGPSLGMNPTIQRMASLLGVHVVSTTLMTLMSQGGCDENR